MIGKHGKIIASHSGQSHSQSGISFLGPKEHVSLQKHQPGLLIFKSLLQHVIALLDILT